MRVLFEYVRDACVHPRVPPLRMHELLFVVCVLLVGSPLLTCGKLRSLGKKVFGICFCVRWCVPSGGRVLSVGA